MEERKANNQLKKIPFYIIPHMYILYISSWVNIQVFQERQERNHKLTRQSKQCKTKLGLNLVPWALKGLRGLPLENGIAEFCKNLSDEQIWVKKWARGACWRKREKIWLTILEISINSIRGAYLSENSKGIIGRRSLLAREGEDNEVAEENFWEEMDKMCRKENYILNIY